QMPEPTMAKEGHGCDLRPMLDDELSQLPGKYRAVIVLCDLEGATRPEAARQLGVPEGTVAGRLARARTRLAKRLARHGLATVGAALALVLSQQAAAAAPTSLVSNTIEVATAVATGQAAAAGAMSAPVAALIRGVLKAMLWNKLKVATVVVLTVHVCV